MSEGTPLWKRRWVQVVGVVVVLSVAIGPFVDDEGAGDGAAADTEPASDELEPDDEPAPDGDGEEGQQEDEDGGDRADVLARGACQHWAATVDDIEAGLLTDSEIREKIQEVHADARLSDTTEVAEDAEELLAAATDGDGYTQAAEAFSQTCVDTGALD